MLTEDSERKKERMIRWGRKEKDRMIRMGEKIIERKNRKCLNEN